VLASLPIYFASTIEHGGTHVYQQPAMRVRKTLRKLEGFNLSDKVPKAFGLGGLIAATHGNARPAWL
jgi:hypothetical protein